MATHLHRIVIALAALVAEGMAPSASAQSTAGRPGALDVRAFMPGPNHVEHGAPGARPRSRLTVEERMETALRDRERGALRSAGEAADVHDLRAPPAPLRVAPANPAQTPVASRTADKPS